MAADDFSARFHANSLRSVVRQRQEVRITNKLQVCKSLLISQIKKGVIHFVKNLSTSGGMLL